MSPTAPCTRGAVHGDPRSRGRRTSPAAAGPPADARTAAAASRRARRRPSPGPLGAPGAPHL
eukprot:5865197-Lingulodinium_polyedra.AAC.1